MSRLKLATLILLSWCASLSAQAQTELDKLMVRRTPNCFDIYYNCALLIPQYFSEQKFDSVQVLLNYWETRCGLNHAMLKIKLLFAIHQNAFSEALYDENIIEFLLYEQSYTQAVKKIRNDPKLGHVPLFAFQGAEEFEAFTTTVARTLLLEKQPVGLARFFCEAYAGNVDSLFIKLQAPEFEDTRLREYYERKRESTLRMSEGYWSLFSGYWTPQGENRILGNHPVLGAQFGIKRKGFLYGLVAQFGFLNTSRPYAVRYEGEIVETKHYFGGFLGFEGGKELWRKHRHEFDVLAGLGWDGFDAIESDKNRKAKSINSLNVNLGLGYRQFFKPYSTHYLSLEGRYNFVNYATHGGSDLSGNTITLRLIYGQLGNARKNNRLRTFDYK